MKKIKFFAVAFAALTMFSCQKEKTTNPGEVPSGIDTYASFSFKVDGATSTYADMPEEGTELEEKAVTDIYMLIFDATNGPAGRLITKAAGDTPDAKTLTVKTTSGSKRIYVLTNVKGKTTIMAKLDALKEDVATLKDFYDLATDGEYVSGDDTDMGAGFKELVEQGKIVMSNVADAGAIYTLHPGISEANSKTPPADKNDDNNNFTFTVYRAVAKANLKVELKEADDKTFDKLFTLKKEVAFAVRNVNRSAYLVQKYSSDMLASSNNDHTKDNSVRPWSPFYDKFDGKDADWYSNISSYKPYFFLGYDFKTTTQIQGAASKSVYFTPNSLNKSLRGNTTYYGIRTQVQAIDRDEIVTAISFDESTLKIKSTPSDTDYDNTDGQEDFYFAREIPMDMLAFFPSGDKIRRVFLGADIAFQAMSWIIKLSPSVTLASNYFTDGGTWTGDELKEAYEGGGTHALVAADIAIVDRYLGHYIKGMSYYRLNMYETTEKNNRRHLIRRNHKYNATVTSFATLGVPKPEDLDKNPEIPVDADVTHVTAVITVADWHDVNMSEDL